MATKSILLPFIITLAMVSLSLSSTEMTFSSHQTIHIRAELGNSTPPAFLNCMVENHAIVNNLEFHSGDDYPMKIRHKGIHRCSAAWGIYMAEFEAYNLERDAGHTSLVWLIAEEGMLFYSDEIYEFILETPWRLMG